MRMIFSRDTGSIHPRWGPLKRTMIQEIYCDSQSFNVHGKVVQLQKTLLENNNNSLQEKFKTTFKFTSSCNEGWCNCNPLLQDIHKDLNLFS